MSRDLRAEPKSVQVNLTSGTGMDIEWKDGHRSSYTFRYLRDACPCALCDEERSQTGREPGEPVKSKPEMLPMLKPAIKPDVAEGIGRSAIRFAWNDGHEHGIYSWDFLRQFCPCPECSEQRRAAQACWCPVHAHHAARALLRAPRTRFRLAIVRINLDKIVRTNI